LGRALQDPINGTTALTRQGITLTATQKAQIEAMTLAGNVAGAQALIIQAVEQRYGGMAQAAAGGTGQLTVMKNAFEELAAKIGEQFAPAISSAASDVADFIDWTSKNKDVVEFGAAVLAAAAGVTGLATALISGTLAFGKMISIMEEAGIVMQALAVSAKVLAAGTGIGLIGIAIYELYEHWNQIWPAMEATFKAFVDNIGNAAQGLWKILTGALHLNLDEIKAGLAQAAAAFVAGGKEISTALTPAKEGQQRDLNAMVAQDKSANDAILAANRARIRQQRSELAAHNAAVLAEQKAAGQVRLLELGNHTAEVIALKKQEDQILKTLADEKFKGDKSALKQQLADIRTEYDLAYARETVARKQFNDTYLKNDKNFQSLSAADQKAYLRAHQAALVGSMQDETAAKEAVVSADIQREINLHNTLLQEQVRYGTAYAELNKAMHEYNYTQAESAAGQMVQLTQSNNELLKSIGKAASVVDIEMKGAQAAMNVYAGFSTIPIVGPALGVAAAAAVEAFTQEKAAQVLGLSQGGLIEGGIPGVDSVPALMMPGELAVPKQNFEEVVNSVAATRQGLSQSPAQQVTVQVEIAFKGQASKILTAQINQDKALGRYRGTS
jgi:hypothetical protein